MSFVKIGDSKPIDAVYEAGTKQDLDAEKKLNAAKKQVKNGDNNSFDSKIDAD